MTAQQLKNSILQMAVQGKLVPQDPNDEPASVLIERISAEKEKLIKEKKIKKEKNPSVIFRGADNIPYEKIGDEVVPLDVPFEIPDSWEWVRLGDIGETNIGLTYKPSDISTSGTAVLRSNNIQNGNMNYDDLVHVTTAVPERAYARKGDILICARNGSRALVGKSAIVERDGMAFGAFMAIFRSICNPYVQLFINSYVFRGQLEGATTTTINQITQDMLKRQLCPLPPYDEQARIVAKYRELEPLIEIYSKAYTSSEDLDKSFAETLKKSILQWAVQGKLVPQDENDEPAEVLLERIRAEKEALIKAGKIKRDKHESVICRRDNSHYEKLDGIERCIDDEIPFEIPKGWAWTSIGSMFNLQAGKNIQASEISECSGENLYPCFGGNGIRGYVPFYNHNGDFPIIGRQGALCGCINRATGIFYATEHAVCVDTFANTNVAWACYFLTALNLNQYATATAQPGLAVSNINHVLIPVPPLAEQQRIVDKIEELIPTIKAL